MLGNIRHTEVRANPDISRMPDETKNNYKSHRTEVPEPFSRIRQKAQMLNTLFPEVRL